MKRVIFRDLKCPVCNKTYECGMMTAHMASWKEQRLDGYTEGVEKYQSFDLECPECHYFYTDPERAPETQEIKEAVLSKQYQDFFTQKKEPLYSYNVLEAKIFLADKKKDKLTALRNARLQLWYVEDYMRSMDEDNTLYERCLKNCADRFSEMVDYGYIELFYNSERLEYIDLVRKSGNFEKAKSYLDDLMLLMELKNLSSSATYDKLLIEKKLIEEKSTETK